MYSKGFNTLHDRSMMGSFSSSWQIGHEFPASTISSLEGGEPYCYIRQQISEKKLGGVTYFYENQTEPGTNLTVTVLNIFFCDFNKKQKYR